MTFHTFLAAMGAPAQGSNPLLGLLPMVAILAIFYFIVLRPMKRRQEKVQAFIAALKVGDKVVTSGGIYGKITRISDDVLRTVVRQGRAGQRVEEEDGAGPIRVYESST